MGQPLDDQPQGVQQMNVQIGKVITYPNVIIPPVTRMPDGGKVLTFITPLGEQINLPMSGEVAKNIGADLMAPGIEIAGSGSLPSQNGAPPSPAS